MEKQDETDLSVLINTLTSLTAVLRGYCYYHCENSKEISKLLEFSEILDTKTNQLFNFV